MQHNSNNVKWLTGVFTGWGIKECWAKLLAGIVIGALGAAGLLCTNACTRAYHQAADGSIEYSNRILLLHPESSVK